MPGRVWSAFGLIQNGMGLGKALTPCQALLQTPVDMSYDVQADMVSAGKADATALRTGRPRRPVFKRRHIGRIIAFHNQTAATSAHKGTGPSALNTRWQGGDGEISQPDFGLVRRRCAGAGATVMPPAMAA
jgi:hypothetical protein